jgi:hypothetical protein
MSRECTSSGCETPGLRMAAIAVWRYQNVEGAGAKTLQTMLSEVKAEESPRWPSSRR